jgi:predicted MPP superfamily phosphohydrolase
MKKIIIYPFFLWVGFILVSACSSNHNKEELKSKNAFTFVFMTDIHLQPERNAVEGFYQAIDSVNKLNPDFVITGGDLVMDVLGQNYNRSDSLYNLYQEAQKRFHMPVYNTMGNHEIFGIYDNSGVPADHPEYGEKMFEKRIGKRYYSFDHKGWHFIILDGIEDTGESRYIGMVDSVQLEWIKTDLQKVDQNTPIVLSTHIPLITVATQLESGALEPNHPGAVINNSKEVLSLFAEHNLMLALQGHLHFLEDIYANGTHFITGGAVSSRWWGGKYNGMEEGFLVIKVNDQEFEWEYFDYGWEVEEEIE